MKRVEQFGRFIGRFWPLWLPLILLVALPWARPFSRIVTDEIGSELVQLSTGDEPPSPMPSSSAHSGDLDLQLWNVWYAKRRNNNYDYSATPDSSHGEAMRLRKRFPSEPLLVAPPLQHELGLSSWAEPWYDYRSPTTDPAAIARELKALRVAALNGGKLEPDNAFWWVSLAHIEWRSKHYDLALRALERAAKCSRYDDYTLALARCLIRARERYSAPSFFEKLEIMEDTRRADVDKQANRAKIWSAHARRLRAKSDVARALRWAGALLVVGDLMQRDPNAWPTAKAGGVWQSEAYRIGSPAKGKAVPARGAADFARFARANGRPDLANLAPKLAAHSRQIVALAGETNGRYGEMLWLRSGSLDKWMNLFEGLPIVLAFNLVYLALWWLSAGLFLWRARGAPSSRRDRVGFGVAVTLVLALMGVLGLWFAIMSDNGIASSLDSLMVSLAVFGFFGAPFVLALICAGLTLRRHHARFSLAPRIDMELALAPWARAFLRWLLPVCALGSIAFLVANWALWLLATWRGWGTVDLLKLLPPDRNDKTGSLLWDSTGPTLLVYGIAMCCLCLLIWFGRWRWTTPVALRPLAQGGLRWWKESVGVAAVAVAWVFLLAALFSLPLFGRAEAQLERVLKVGELETRGQ